MYSYREHDLVIGDKRSWQRHRRSWFYRVRMFRRLFALNAIHLSSFFISFPRIMPRSEGRFDIVKRFGTESYTVPLVHNEESACRDAQSTDFMSMWRHFTIYRWMRFWIFSSFFWKNAKYWELLGSDFYKILGTGTWTKPIRLHIR